MWKFDVEGGGKRLLPELPMGYMWENEDSHTVPKVIDLTKHIYRGSKCPTG
jgi:hypothetical protein